MVMMFERKLIALCKFSGIAFSALLENWGHNKDEGCATIPLITERLFKNGKAPHWIGQMNAVKIFPSYESKLKDVKNYVRYASLPIFAL